VTERNRRRTTVALALGSALLLLVVSSALSAGPSRSRGAGAAVHLPYSTAGNLTVQRQPAAGSCHAIGSGRDSRPDPRCTPGALNPQVTQATIGVTICRSGWTSTVRPPESVTEAEKRASMAAYGDRGSLGAYEYDHFVPLELGGATNDPRNLWPEPGASPNPKDAVEDLLKASVCGGRMTLAAAQRAIVTNWVSLAAPGRGTPVRPAPKPRCSARAQYDTRYHDYDVYVDSNQPDAAVTVSGAGAPTATWHTNGSGSADVYFHAGSVAAGRRVTVRAGAASCSTTL
jgi:hypothetical protein